MNIALVTGASSGMGRELARLLAAEPDVDELWAVARRADRLQALQAELDKPVLPLVLDLADPASIDRLAAQLAAQKPRVRYLVNAAGFGKFGDNTQIALADQTGMIDVNARALVAVTQTALPYMQAGDRIIQLCSSSAFFPLPYLNVYAATKAFVQHYSYGLAQELKPRGISVTQVSPGWVQTEFFNASQNQTAKAPKVYKPMYTARQVAERALKDAKKGKQVSVCGAFVKLHRLCGRFAPRWFMNAQWRSRF